MSRRKLVIGRGMHTQSFAAVGFSPSHAYGDYAKPVEDDQKLKAAVGSSRANRKVSITLPTAPFDWKSDPATSTPHAPPAPVDVRPPSLPPQTAAMAATLSTDRR